MQFTISATALKNHLAETIEYVSHGDRFLITRNGRAIAAIVSKEDLEMLQQLRSCNKKPSRTNS